MKRRLLRQGQRGGTERSDRSRNLLLLARKLSRRRIGNWKAVRPRPVAAWELRDLVIDLGAEHTVRGFSHPAGRDNGWNGANKDCEFFISKTPDQLDKTGRQSHTSGNAESPGSGV